MKRTRSAPGKKKTRRRKRKSRHSSHKLIKIFAAIFSVILLYVVYLDFTVRSQFDGKRWSIPAKVYARPLELYIGKPLTSTQLKFELEKSGYRANSKLREGEFHQQQGQFQFVTRAFDFWDGHQPPRYVNVTIDDGFISRVYDYRDKNDIDVVRLEPAIIGRIYPHHSEDRTLVKIDDVPSYLVDALLAVEDRQFYTHMGINPKAILRALLANVRAGGVVQGGSTLTQQLVKNFFLSKKRSLWRKANEAIMSLLLEFHYEKDEIMEAYINEIYLGQDKKRAIHGFGLASYFYFDKPLYKLRLSQVATLVALVRGPSYYDPWRHTSRLLKRRNNVLKQMHQQGAITAYEFSQAQKENLSILKRPKGTRSNYPAFMALLHRQLQKDYDKKDLSSEGLQVFSTFEPYVQDIVNREIKSRLDKLDDNLQTAIIVTRTSNAEILAVAGGKEPGYAGFNRAIDAYRPIGSLIKPAIYLTALQQAGKYSLTTPVEDKAISIKAENGDIWSPRNYSATSHGLVPMYQALIRSYNQATVRLGFELGFEPIVNTLKKLGVKKDIPPYPSMLLGSVTLSPFEVTQMYQSIANEGFVTPIHTIREVLDASGNPLKRYPLKVTQGVDATSVRILNSALNEVTRLGTARSLAWRLPKGLTVAGKTGTTNDTRDSWFAGYSGEHLIVSWMGTDDNQSTGLTGASGALPLWAGIVKKLHTRPLTLTNDENLEYHYVEPVNGKLSDKDCNYASQLAFRTGEAPEEYGACPESPD